MRWQRCLPLDNQIVAICPILVSITSNRRGLDLSKDFCLSQGSMDRENKKNENLGPIIWTEVSVYSWPLRNHKDQLEGYYEVDH